MAVDYPKQVLGWLEVLQKGEPWKLWCLRKETVRREILHREDKMLSPCIG